MVTNTWTKETNPGFLYTREQILVNYHILDEKGI